MHKYGDDTSGFAHTADGLFEWKDSIDLKEYFKNMKIDYEPKDTRPQRERPSGNPFESNGVYHLEFGETSNMFGEDETAYRLVADTDVDIKDPETNEIRHVCAGQRGGYMTPDSVIETKNGVPAGWIFDDAKLIGSTIKFASDCPEDMFDVIPNTVLKGHASVVDSHIEAGWQNDSQNHNSVLISQDALLVNSEISKASFKGRATVYGANTYGHNMDGWSTDIRKDGTPSAKNQCASVQFEGDSILYDNCGRIGLTSRQSIFLNDTFITTTDFNDLFSDVETDEPIELDLSGASIQSGKILSGHAYTGLDMHRHVFSSEDGQDLTRKTEDWLLQAIGLRFVQLQPEFEKKYTPDRDKSPDDNADKMLVRKQKLENIRITNVHSDDGPDLEF